MTGASGGGRVGGWARSAAVTFASICLSGCVTVVNQLPSAEPDTPLAAASSVGTPGATAISSPATALPPAATPAAASPTAAATATPAATDVVPAQRVGSWTWWYLVDGTWRWRQVGGVQPSGGVLKSGIDPTNGGKVTAHLVVDPGQGVARDRLRDVAGPLAKHGGPGDIDIVLDSASLEGPQPGFPGGSVDLNMELLDVVPDGATSLTYGWYLDIDGDGLIDYIVQMDIQADGTRLLWLGDGHDPEKKLVGSDFPGTFEVVGDNVFASVRFESVGRSLRVSVQARAVDRHGYAVQTTEEDTAPDYGWMPAAGSQ